MKPSKNWYSTLPKYHNHWNFSVLRLSIIFSIFKLLSIIILICQTLGLVGPVQQKMKLPLPNCHQILTYQQPFLLLSRNLPDFKALLVFFPVILSDICQNYLLSWTVFEYLAVPLPTLGHDWGDSLSHPVLITVL